MAKGEAAVFKQYIYLFRPDQLTPARATEHIFAEGQRRYVESLSAYARQFLGQMEKPDVDQIEGLSPAVSIDQKGVSHNPRSTVGTVTEIYDFIRLLYARAGLAHCYQCGQPIVSQSIDGRLEELSYFIPCQAFSPNHLFQN